MSLKKSFEKLKFDKRMIQWNLKHGVISEDELKNHMDKLEDLSSGADHFYLDEKKAIINGGDSSGIFDTH